MGGPADQASEWLARAADNAAHYATKPLLVRIEALEAEVASLRKTLHEMIWADRVVKGLTSEATE